MNSHMVVMLFIKIFHKCDGLFQGAVIIPFFKIFSFIIAEFWSSTHKQKKIVDSILLLFLVQTLIYLFLKHSKNVQNKNEMHKIPIKIFPTFFFFFSFVPSQLGISYNVSELDVKLQSDGSVSSNQFCLWCLDLILLIVVL